MPRSGSGSKRASERQLKQSFNSGNKKQCFWPCPTCNRSFASYVLDDHVNQCAQRSYCGSSRPHLESSNGRARSISPPPPSRSISVDVLAVLQAIADETPAAPGIVHAEDSADFRYAVNSHDLPCESGSRPTHIQLGNCNAPFQLNFSVPSEDDLFCTQADTSLCTDGLCGSQDIAEVSVDELRVLDHFSGREGSLAGCGESGRPEPGMRNLGCQEITEIPVETGSAVDACTVKTTDTTTLEQRDCEIAKEGNRPDVEKPSVGFKLYQRQKKSQAKLSMFFKQPSTAAEERRPSVTVLQPGMILFKNRLDLENQQRLVQESQNVAHLFHRPVTSGGGKYHIYSMCWGPKWNPKSHRYAGSGAERPLPDWMFDLAQEISREAQQYTSVYPSDLEFAPDVALANFYPVKDEELGVIGLGGHQDLDDSCTMPVVSVSVGDSMTFFYRRLPPLSRRKSMIYVSVDEKAAKGCEDGDVAHNREQQIVLRSGDVLVFGGKSRLVYHGTRHVQAGTRPPGLHMVPGRLNFTFRQTDASLIAQKSRSSS